MRIVIQDFGGYPFPIELSRELASRGHDVMHAFCGSIPTTPGGQHRRLPTDPETLTVENIQLDQPLNKYSFVKRWRQEREYGRKVVEVIPGFKPDLVASANTPLDAQKMLQAWCRKSDVRFAFWLQDILGLATDRILRKKLWLAGAVIGGYYLNMEKSCLRQSDRVIVISDDFRELLAQWGVESARVVTIENWAPLGELPSRPKSNRWSQANGLADQPCVMYTGTMGMKHNPELIWNLAVRMDRESLGQMVVVTQGVGGDYLKSRLKEEPIDSLRIMDYGSFEEIPDRMGTADVLVAILEPDAGNYSVPSKVLAYLCAARPIVAAIPGDNLAARIIRSTDAGRVVEPDDPAGFSDQVVQLLKDEALRLQLGSNARAYAEKTFSIENIADLFLEAVA